MRKMFIYLIQSNSYQQCISVYTRTCWTAIYQDLLGTGRHIYILLIDLVHSQGFSCYSSILRWQLNFIKLMSLIHAVQISMPGLIPQLWISSYSSWPSFTNEHGMGFLCDYCNQNLNITMF